MIEKRAYTKENSSSEDIKLIEDQVYLLEDDIIYLKEAPVISEFQIEIMWKKVQSLINPNKKYFILIDLVVAKPPSAELRGPLKGWMKRVSPNIIAASVFTEKNRLINLVAKFVLFGSGFPNFFVSKTREEAMAKIKISKT